MSQPPSKSAKSKTPPPPPPAPEPAGPMPSLYRRIDWLTFTLTTLLVFIGYYLTLAPDLTLEDSGELAVGSFYAGVPHPPGYPIWTIYSWLFTQLIPFSNIAWRVALSSAVAGALSSGLIALMVSRGSSMMVEGIAELKAIERRWENIICMVAGFVAGMLFGFNGFVWSQAVIVEVYPLSCLSFVAVLCCLLRWVYAPHQLRYLYTALFLFGICLTNHQTLIVAAMGIEVLILAVRPRLGRDVFAANVGFYLLGLLGKANGWTAMFDNNMMLFAIFNAVGVGSLMAVAGMELQKQGIVRWLALGAYFAVSAIIFVVIVSADGRGQAADVASTLKIFVTFHIAALAALVYFSWTSRKEGRFGSEWLPVAIMVAVYGLGAAFYFYMPVTSMTNPPMNWGYPRTWDGFLHALSRGQYERTNPTNIFADPHRFFNQLVMYFEGAVEEYNLVYLLIALVPFLFFLRMQKRERGWLIGLVGIYLGLAVLLLVLLNPSPDRQSRGLTKVFFANSHVFISMGVGYGLTLIAAAAATQYQRYRIWFISGGAVACAVALYAFAGLTSPLPLARFTAEYGLVMAAATVVIFLVARVRAPLVPMLALFTLMPAWSVLSHWSDNEQRGHLFGYWFGHDMFTPPMTGADGRPIYPEMARDAVLFGGTDPGRFAPTYMIFCESFIPESCKPRDPKFNRRDVYLITQNALADNTYLNYIRAHYNRSTQHDTPFLQEMFRGGKEREKNLYTNGLAEAVGPIDRALTSFGASVEARRRKEGVYPLAEIHTPSPAESQQSFNDYIVDAQRRLQLHQLKPGEDVEINEGRVQVKGQVAVMAINGLLTRVIFDQNPDHEFYVEESFPLDWMYPHLEPFGIIMKINRKPSPSLSEEAMQRDHDFWSKYSDRLIGNWITYDTPVSNICQFVERVYERRDYTGFTGDRKFIRDDQAQKSFSKLRSSIGGIYAWRLGPDCPPEYRPKTPAEQQRLLKEADFAFRQSFAFCPYSPEAVFRYAQLLANSGRVADARLIAETCQKLDPLNGSVDGLVKNLEAMEKQRTSAVQVQSQIGQLEQAYRANPTNVTNAFNLVQAYFQVQLTNQGLQLLEQLVTNPLSDVSVVLNVAQAYAQLNDAPRLEVAMLRLVKLMPDSAEAWYDLAGIQAALGKSSNALTALTRAIELNSPRVGTAGVKDLRAVARTDRRFTLMVQMPEFQKLIAPK